MKYSCGIIRDLIPLYCDKICSEDTVEAVEEHMRECQQCSQYYARMSQTELEQNPIDLEKYDQQQVASMKKVKKKMKMRNRIFCVIGVLIGVVLVLISSRLMIYMGAIGVLTWDTMSAKVEVHEDIERYQDYIGVNAIAPYTSWGEDQSIFPDAITEEMDVKEFRFVYYNPWDAQYVYYLTVAYSDDDYEKEVGRLQTLGVEAYEGIYSVTGEPEDYNMLAMNSDEYYGFIYAMTPEAESNSITYVGITFCNYFLDLDIHDYLPEEYLLEGFDANVDNPYREKMLE